MKRAACLVLAALSIAGCNASAKEPPAKAAPGDILISAQWGMAMNAAQRGDAGMVVQSLQPAMSDEIYPQLSPEKKYEVAELYAQAADSLALWSEAHRGFERASALPQSTPEDWDSRMATAASSGLAADAWLAFDHLRRRGGPVLQTFGGRQLSRLDALLGSLPNARDARLALGRQMEIERRDPRQGFNDESIVWAHYAEALLEAGDLAHAKAAADRITDPVVVSMLLADTRFDAVVASNPKLADPKVAAERYLAWAQQQAKADPRQLTARIAIVRALALLDRPEDALAVAQETERAMARDANFDDASTEGVFLQGWKAALLVRLGRGPEAVAALTYAASCHCSPMSAVQLGQALLRTGNAKEAEGWLHDAELERLGVEDQMAVFEARACVAADLRDAKGVEENLAILRQRRAVSPQALARALVCAGRTEDAAAEVAAELADPHTRLTGLQAVQVYADPDHQPFSGRMRDRWAEVVARPAVREALGKVGRSKQFEIEARGGVA